ncbi:MAG TPA: hypothetical protein VGI48_13685 [Caldimonas sp.]|jgi:hypothetical protein
METVLDPAMLEASDLTAKQLEEATNIVEAEFGADPGGRNDALIAAVLSTLARNYGMGLALAGR